MTIRMKTLGISVTRDSVTLIASLLAHRIETGVELNAFPRDGFVTVIQIVSMALTKILLFILVHHRRPVKVNNFNARIIDVSTRTGFATMTMIVRTVYIN